MIEIIFGHKIENKILTVNKLSIGHGLSKHGQLDFISLITEEIGEDGVVIFAKHHWGFGFWRFKEFFVKNKIKIKSLFKKEDNTVEVNLKAYICEDCIKHFLDKTEIEENSPYSNRKKEFVSKYKLLFVIPVTAYTGCCCCTEMKKDCKKASFNLNTVKLPEGE